MKRKLLLFLIIVAVMCCFFALTASAEDAIPGQEAGEVTHTYYLVKSADSAIYAQLTGEGKQVVAMDDIVTDTDPSNNKTASNPFFGQFADGSHVELILAENILASYAENEGMLINTAITVTLRLNGFVHAINNNCRRNAFSLFHKDAVLRVIGNHGIQYDENQNVSVITPTILNDTITDAGNVDIFHRNKVYAWIHEGTAYFENVNAFCGEELAYQENSGTETTASLVNCAVKSNACPIASARNVTSKSCVYNSQLLGNVVLYSITSGTTFVNTTITGNFEMDCWTIKNQMAVFKNTEIKGKIATSSGRTHFTFIDCTINIDTMSLGSDGGGKCYALVYTSADCENDGTLNIYRNGSGSTPVTDDTIYPYSMVEEYEANNKAAGHSYSSWDISFAGAKFASAFTASKSCANCGDTLTDGGEGAIITCAGYSVSQYGNQSITVGYWVNFKAISKYEELSGKEISLGCVVAARDLLGQGIAPLDENGNAVALEKGNVVKADATKHNLTSYMSLNVLLGEQHVDEYLLLTAYVIEASDSEAEVSYIQETGTVTNNQFSYVSYNNH